MTTTFYTATEAAELLPFDPRTLMRFAREKKIGHVKLGERKIRFTPEHIAEFITAHTVPAQTAATKPARNPKYK